MHSWCFRALSWAVALLPSPFRRWIHAGSLFKGCKQKGLIPAILVVCGNPAVVQNMFQIYGVAVPLASGHARTC